ncbi:MAG: hypothetical protein AAGH65_02350 [Pseudomonadota bacterium]
MALITIDQLYDLTLAQMARMKLESERIPVHLSSEGFASLFGVQSSYSEVKIQVPEEYEQRARRVLDSLYQSIGERGLTEPPEDR